MGTVVFVDPNNKCLGRWEAKVCPLARSRMAVYVLSDALAIGDCGVFDLMATLLSPFLMLGVSSQPSYEITTTL